jgi:hypothetical protein
VFGKQELYCPGPGVLLWWHSAASPQAISDRRSALALRAHQSDSYSPRAATMAANIPATEVLASIAAAPEYQSLRVVQARSRGKMVSSLQCTGGLRAR